VSFAIEPREIGLLIVRFVSNNRRGRYMLCDPGPKSGMESDTACSERIPRQKDARSRDRVNCRVGVRLPFPPLERLGAQSER